MNKFRFVFLSFLFVSATAFSMEKETSTAYVGVQEVIAKSKQGKRIKAKLEKSLAKIKKEIQATEKKLQEEKMKLEKDLPLLSEKKRAESIQRFQQKVLNSQQEVEAKKTKLQESESELMDPVLKRMHTVIASVAQKKGYTVVKNRDQGILWVSPNKDLTRDVLKQFNKKFK